MPTTISRVNAAPPRNLAPILIPARLGSPRAVRTVAFPTVALVLSRPRDGLIRIVCFKGYGLGCKCLFQDNSQIDTSQYTHVHFAFGTLTLNFEVKTGDKLSTYEFNKFKRITGAKKILSFGELGLLNQFCHL